MNRTDTWHPTHEQTTNRSTQVRPAFMVNPLVITINDDMAEELTTHLRKTATTHPMPPSIYALMRQIENDLKQAQT